MTEIEFAPVFAIMIDYFGAKPSEAVTNVYYEAFKDWSIDEFKIACRSVMESRLYNGLPKIAELKESIYGNMEDAKVIAFESMIQAVQGGAWYSIEFEDGAIAHAIESMGGLQRICGMTWEDWKYRRKEFESLYISHLKRGNTEPVKLIGLFESNNSHMEEWKQFIPESIKIPSKNKLMTKHLNREYLIYKDE